jgi:hypothetical protein
VTPTAPPSGFSSYCVQQPPTPLQYVLADRT